MNNPRNIVSDASVWLVSLICLPLAALLLLLPLQRLVVPMWPVTIEEHRFGDGSTQLSQVGTRDLSAGLLRSRPLSAAVLDLDEGEAALGYVVAMRSDPTTESEAGSTEQEIISLALPNQPFWRPVDQIGPDSSCKLALSQPGEPPLWLACDSVLRVVLPNQLTLIEKLQVAIARLSDYGSLNAATLESGLNPYVVDAEDPHPVPQ